MRMSLTKRLAVAGLAGFCLLVIGLSLGVRLAADTIAEINTDAFLSTYADVLIPAITINDGIASVDAGNPVIARMPRDWQISQDHEPRQRSSRLQSWLPLEPGGDGVRLRINDADGREIVALQRQYRFPENTLVTVSFGLDAEIADAYAADQREALRRRLLPWFLGAGLIATALLASQIAIVVLPLNRLRRDIDALEGGQSGRLSTRYPPELRSLTQGMNAQLDHNAAVVARYRQFAGNLAHAIKTPLTVLRLAADTAETRKNVEDIHNIVERNLARARIVGTSPRATALVDVEPLLQGLARSYRKLSSIEMPAVTRIRR